MELSTFRKQKTQEERLDAVKRVQETHPGYILVVAEPHKGTVRFDPLSFMK